MESRPVPSSGWMYHLIIIRPEPPGRFTAQPLGVPEIRVEAATEQEALEQARHALSQWGGSLHWVPVEVPPPNGRPLHAGAGHAKDDPDFDAYVEEIQRYRQQVEQRE